MASANNRQIKEISQEKVQQVNKDDIQDNAQEDQSKPAMGQPGFFNRYGSNFRVAQL